MPPGHCDVEWSQTNRNIVPAEAATNLYQYWLENNCGDGQWQLIGNEF